MTVLLVFPATQLSVVPVAAWLEGAPQAHTRRSAFAALAAWVCKSVP